MFRGNQWKRVYISLIGFEFQSSGCQEKQIAKTPFHKAARLSVGTRSFPYLPFDRVGFVLCQLNLALCAFYKRLLWVKNRANTIDTDIYYYK